ncbi:TonB-dependent receptor [Paraflavitalea soli]|uniref:TonB-dependent receptor n=1 Tax=Paraflavitalea soli TaxID=2315862 RepID=A0A3B7MLK3_9BACT|nr:outer membrane beta-barrel protein [Paraflavitalea soli]AXY72475.1 TonB-dependent receptor [Paraflavitalea soli]
MKSFFTILCTMLFSVYALAQSNNKTISGQVKDIQNEPVPGATLRLVQAKDSATVQTKTARDNGRFEFSNLPNGVYLLVITATGTQKYTSAPLTLEADRTQLVLPAIILLPQKKANLKEVVVVAKKPLIEQDIDKTIVNVESMISASTSNTLEVLEKTPGITVDANGEISLQGSSGVNVLIDGRPTYMSGRDLAAYLRSLPGGMLDKIELMPNPPAKYDAAGGAVINIRLKKKRTEGYAGSLSLNYNQGKLARSYNSLNLNYLNRKVNLFGNFSYGRYADFNDDVSNRVFYGSSAQKSASVGLENYSTSGSNEFNGRIGMDYTVSSKTTLGFIVNGSARRRKEYVDYVSNSYSAGDVLDSIGWGGSDNTSNWRQLNGNINLQHKFDDAGRELTADINYINYNNKGDQVLQNFVSGSSGGQLRNQDFYYNLPSNIDIYTARADYSHPLKNKASLSGGVKTSFVENDNQSDYYAVMGGTHTPDYGRSNHFIYRENINALYVNGRKDWKRIGMQLGLRLENTQTKGRQLGNAVVPASTFTNDYTGLFSTVYVSYKLDSLGKHNLILNYSRRVNRPGYQQLNPFLFFVDQYSYSTGNPYLQPSYNNSVSLTYRYKQFFNGIFNVERATDGFFGASRVEDNILITRPENIATRQLIAVLLYFNTLPAKWWTLNFHIAGAQFSTKGQLYTENLDIVMYTWRTNLLSQFRFNKDWSAEFYGAYNAAINNWQRMVQPRYWVNAAIQKKILKGKGNLKINVEDIFRTMKWDEELKGLKQAQSHRVSFNDTRRVGISFSYSFGKETFTRKRKYNDNTADDVKERVQ